MSINDVNIYFIKKKTLIQKTTLSTVDISLLRISIEAANRIVFLCKKNKKIGYVLQINFKKGGCGGFLLVFKLVEKVPVNWLIFSNYNASICIAQNSIKFIGGSILGLTKNSSFILLNPKIIDNCSCGKSFKINNNYIMN